MAEISSAGPCYRRISISASEPLLSGFWGCSPFFSPLVSACAITALPYPVPSLTGSYPSKIESEHRPEASDECRSLDTTSIGSGVRAGRRPGLAASALLSFEADHDFLETLLLDVARAYFMRLCSEVSCCCSEGDQLKPPTKTFKLLVGFLRKGCRPPSVPRSRPG